MNSRLTLIIGALLGLLAVALGAFGAHALKQILTENGRTDTYELATRYMMYHSVALLVIGLINRNNDAKWLRYSAAAFLGGVVIFSGSLFLLSILNARFLGMVTPLGGLLLLAGWLMMLTSFVRQK